MVISDHFHIKGRGARGKQKTIHKITLSRRGRPGREIRDCGGVIIANAQPGWARAHQRACPKSWTVGGAGSPPAPRGRGVNLKAVIISIFCMPKQADLSKWPLWKIIEFAAD